MFGRDLRGERDLAEVSAGEDGRVDELLEAYRFEVGELTCSAIGIERSAELPSGGDRDRRGKHDVAGVGSVGIDKERVPAEEREIFARGGAGGETRRRGGGEKVDLHLKLGDALRDSKVIG